MFTFENTHGFSRVDCDLLNAAASVLIARGIDEKNAADIVNNNWRETGNTVQSLCGIERVTVTLVNPYTGATVARDVTELTHQEMDGYLLDNDVCERLHDLIAPCTPAEFLAAYVDAVGPKNAGRVILGS
jgi:hypothetical protein